MSSSGDDDEDVQFFESLDRIPSEEEEDVDLVQENSRSGISNRRNNNDVEGAKRNKNSSKYEIWKGEPGSVKERRQRLLRELGLSNDGDLKADVNANGRRVHFSEFQPAAECTSSDRALDGSILEKPLSDGSNPRDLANVNSPNGRIKLDQKKHNLGHLNRTDTKEPTNLHSLQSFSSGDLRDEVGEVTGGVNSASDSSGELFCKIKNLDNGKEFVVNEISEDGTWNKLREVDTGRQLTGEEFFQRVVGHSPLVQELMKRESVEQTTQKQGSDSNSINGLKTKKKGGWLKTIKGVAHTMRSSNKEKKSSDERDTSSEKGGRRSSSATDESQDFFCNMLKKTKVWQYGKSCKEFTALFMGQEIKAHQGSIWALKFSLDGRYLASGGQDRTVHVWQVTESKQKQDVSVEKPEEGISNNYANANGSTEYVSMNIENPADKKKKGMFMGGRKSSSTSADCIFPPESIFKLSEKPHCSFQGHLDDILDLSWSQSQYLLSSSMDKTVRLWHISQKNCLRMFKHNDYVTCIQFNPIDDRYFISGSLDKKVRIWSILSHKVVDWTDIYEMVTAACYTPDGQGAFVGTHKGKCLSYNASGNRLQEDTHIDVQKKKKSSRGKKITGFQFVPGNSRKVLITSADSRLRILDGSELVQKFKGFRNTNSQISASFTMNGKYIVSASEDSYVYIWNYDFPSNPAAKDQGICRAYEYFLSRKVSAAIPWPGMKSETFALSSGELIPAHGHNPELFAHGIGNGGRKSGPFPHPSTSQGCEVSPGSPLVPISDSIAGSLQVNLTSSANLRAPDHSSPNHGLFVDSLSKGSATWPEEKLPAFTFRSPNLASSELPNNSICDSGDNHIQDQSTPTAWGLVIVTAGLGGEIRTFQNYGWPVRI
ncbi:hypothetical protein SUGI_0448640 [Cryptomeria japonica]|nr:hypothetical protein SUGI_0448640 [Cryptomeria japonica]